jgi:hypothetical protein
MPMRIKRIDVKRHICGTMKSKDKDVIQGLVNRFTLDTKGYGKGTKKNPGYFYEFKADIWQAFALAVTYIDKYKFKI